MMSKKKGVSAEEKRTRMLDLFYEKKDFFQLKELEKIAPKEKGIIAQSVKDVIQSLVDDGMVDTEKIGTSVYFWAYPSKAKVSREKRLNDLNEKSAQVRTKLQNSKQNLHQAKMGKDDSDERSHVIQQVAELNKIKQELLNEMKKYKDSDPEVLEIMKKENEESKEAANRWTENIYAMKSWCKNKFSIEEGDLNKQFGIPAELDYVE